MTYSERVIAQLEERYSDQPEFIQAAKAGARCSPRV